MDGPLFTSAIGFFSGSLEGTGSGGASNVTETIIIGGTPVIDEVLIVTLPNNNGLDGMAMTMAAALH